MDNGGLNRVWIVSFVAKVAFGERINNNTIRIYHVHISPNGSINFLIEKFYYGKILIIKGIDWITFCREKLVEKIRGIYEGKNSKIAPYRSNNRWI